jgi:TadE-like protein/PKD domain
MNPRHRIPAPSLPSRGPDRHDRSRGQALVELALVVPILLLVLVAAGDLARVFAARITIESAARAGAMEASIHPASFVEDQPCDVVSNRVMCAVLTESRGGAIGIAPADVTVDCYDDLDVLHVHHHHHEGTCTEGLGHMIVVTIVGHVQLLTPLLASFTGGQSFDTTATAAAQISVRPNISGVTSTPAPTPGFTPLPLPTPTPDPSAPPTPEPTAAPTPSPTPFCALPVANFSVDPVSRTGQKGKEGHGTPFTFTDHSTTTPLCPLTWSWNFGDGGGATSLSSLENPTHTYETQSGSTNNPGAFHVVLVASSAGGSSSHEVLVTVTP